MTDFEVAEKTVKIHLTKPIYAGKIKIALGACSNYFVFSPYATIYFNNLERAYSEYGERGVVTQLLYILTNTRAMGPDGKKLKEMFFDFAKKEGRENGLAE